VRRNPRRPRPAGRAVLSLTKKNRWTLGGARPPVGPTWPEGGADTSIKNRLYGTIIVIDARSKWWVPPLPYRQLTTVDATLVPQGLRQQNDRSELLVGRNPCSAADAHVGLMVGCSAPAQRRTLGGHPKTRDLQNSGNFTVCMYRRLCPLSEINLNTGFCFGCFWWGHAASR
jgi:hypothetical protein